MAIKQISVFAENRHGSIYEITSVLEKENIDIKALSIADTSDYGILRMIVNDTDKAYAALKKAGMTVKVNEVLGVEIDDVPGGFSKIVKVLCDNNIDMSYTYAFLSPKERKACVIIRVDNNTEAAAALLRAGVSLVSGDSIF